jgi:hypothetical protein
MRSIDEVRVAENIAGPGLTEVRELRMATHSTFEREATFLEHPPGRNVFRVTEGIQPA